MISHTTDAIAADLVREMRASAAHQRALKGCRDPRKTISHRTGWALVSIGLRLASRSDVA